MPVTSDVATATIRTLVSEIPEQRLREIVVELVTNGASIELFLAPDLVKAAIEGRLPRGMGVARLCDLPAEWSRQHPDPRLHPSISFTIEPVSARDSLYFRETGFRGQRQRRPNSRPNSPIPLRRPSPRGAHRQFGVIR